MKKLFLLGLLSAGAFMAADDVQAQPTTIGTTTYDLQSNGSSGNRIFRHTDGTISTVWTQTCALSADPWPLRGIGYNYYNGTTWELGPDGNCDTSPSFGISDVRVGWPEIAGFWSGKELVVSHSPLFTTSRPQKGGAASNWTATTAATIDGPAEGDTWPRMVVDMDNNTAHMVASGNLTVVNSVMSGIAYYRSTDEGATWTEVELPGNDSSSFNDIGGDNYAIHANKGVVAITAGSFESDWVMWKSHDNGLTWTKHFVRKFDPTNVTVDGEDSLYLSNDGYHAVLVDNDGRAHAWAGMFGITITVDNSQPNGYAAEFIIPQTEGLWYWNDAIQTEAIALVEEREQIHPDSASGAWIGNGTITTPALVNSYQGSYTGQPNAAVAENGDIYVVYSGIVEGTSNTGGINGQSFRDLYIVKGTNGGMTWSCPVNIALALDGDRTDFEEDVFPSVHRFIGSDNLLHLMWQQDDEPGIHVRIDLDPAAINNILYRAIDVTDITFPANCVVNSTEDAVAYVHSIEAKPNPTTGVTTVSVDLKQNASIAVRVTNLLGQEVQTISARQFTAGQSNDITIDLSAQPAGVYLYSVMSDDFTVTKRLVKQ